MEVSTLYVIIALVAVVLIIFGAVKTFKRQPVVAILCIIFLFPIWLIWCFVEIFTSSAQKK